MIIQVFTVLIILCTYFIASRYFLLPNGHLRKARISFYICLGTFPLYLLIINILKELQGDSWDYLLELMKIAGLVPLLIFTLFYAISLEYHYNGLKCPKRNINTSFNVIGIRLTLDLVIQWIDSSCEDTLHFTLKEMTGKPLGDFLHKDSSDALMQIKEYAFNNEDIQSRAFVVKFIKKEETPGWANLVIDKEFHGKRAFSLRVGLQDLTNNIKEKRLLESLKLALDATENIGLTISSLSSGKIIYVNRYDADLHGYTQDELIGEYISIYSPDFLITDYFPSGDSAKIHTTLNVTKSGKIIPVRLHTNISIQIGYKITFCEQLKNLSSYESLITGENKTLLLVLDENYQLYWMNDNVYALLDISLKSPIPRLKELFTSESYQRLIQGIVDEQLHVYELNGEKSIVSVYLSTFQGIRHYFLVGHPEKTTDDTETIDLV